MRISLWKSETCSKLWLSSPYEVVWQIKVFSNFWVSLFCRWVAAAEKAKEAEAKIMKDVSVFCQNSESIFWQSKLFWEPYRCDWQIHRASSLEVKTYSAVRLSAPENTITIHIRCTFKNTIRIPTIPELTIWTSGFWTDLLSTFSGPICRVQEMKSPMDKSLDLKAFSDLDMVVNTNCSWFHTCLNIQTGAMRYNLTVDKHRVDLKLQTALNPNRESWDSSEKIFNT